MERTPVLAVEDLKISYGKKTAISGLSLEVFENEIFGIIGPANSGKTSFLRAINRMDAFSPDMKVEGSLRFMGKEVADWRKRLKPPW